MSNIAKIVELSNVLRQNKGDRQMEDYIEEVKSSKPLMEKIDTIDIDLLLRAKSMDDIQLKAYKEKDIAVTLNFMFQYEVDGYEDILNVLISHLLSLSKIDVVKDLFNPIKDQIAKYLGSSVVKYLATGKLDNFDTTQLFASYDIFEHLKDKVLDDTSIETIAHLAGRSQVPLQYLIGTCYSIIAVETEKDKSYSKFFREVKKSALAHWNREFILYLLKVIKSKNFKKKVLKRAFEEWDTEIIGIINDLDCWAINFTFVEDNIIKKDDVRAFRAIVDDMWKTPSFNQKNFYLKAVIDAKALGCFKILIEKGVNVPNVYIYTISITEQKDVEFYKYVNGLGLTYTNQSPYTQAVRAKNLGLVNDIYKVMGEVLLKDVDYSLFQQYDDKDREILDYLMSKLKDPVGYIKSKSINDDQFNNISLPSIKVLFEKGFEITPEELYSIIDFRTRIRFNENQIVEFVQYSNAPLFSIVKICCESVIHEKLVRAIIKKVSHLLQTIFKF